MDRCFGCNRAIGKPVFFIRHTDVMNGGRYQAVHKGCWAERRGGWLWPTDHGLYLRTGAAPYLRVLAGDHGPVQLRRETGTAGCWFVRCPRCGWESVRFGSKARAAAWGEAHWIVDHARGAAEYRPHPAGVGNRSA